MSKKISNIRLGIDVGGTFTDFVMIADNDLKLFKRLSTPSDPSIGVISGLKEMAQHYSFQLSDITSLVHGTTVVANSLIERKGDKTALITTEGFRDVLEIGREVRYDIYDLGLENPEPLVTRDMRFTIKERTLADGTVRTHPDEKEVREVVRQIAAAGVRTVAICLLHSHRNSENERLVADIVRQEAPKMFLSLSSEIAPEIREYERMSTTVANAFVRPLVDGYLEKLDNELKQLGFHGSLHIMLSQGGITTLDFCRKFPIQIVESGPAAGVQAVCYIGRRVEDNRIVSFDMGGTTAKVCVIDDCEPDLTVDTEVARIHRFKKGSGLPLKIPSVELLEIGAGGGSIARLDAMRLLKVGPQSAGADPGPACYGLGGQDPTVTDADLILGYLNADNFLGGKMRLDVAAAEDAVNRSIATPLGVSVVEAAAGIVGLANENMAAAARLHIAERGRDTEEYSLTAFGGAGPVHAYGIARALRLKRMRCPRGAGNLSALGFLVAPVGIKTVRSYVSHVDAIDWDHLAGLVQQMSDEARTIIEDAGVSWNNVTRRLSAEMRYVGQGYEVSIEVTPQQLQDRNPAALIELFEREYEKLFQMRLTGVSVEVLNWRLASRGPVPDAPLGIADAKDGQAKNAAIGRRKIYIPELREFAMADVYDRYKLSSGATFPGPCIIEERESTFVINGPAQVTVDHEGNLAVELTYGQQEAEKPKAAAFS